jgi:hypothetical protein
MLRAMAAVLRAVGGRLDEVGSGLSKGRSSRSRTLAGGDPGTGPGTELHSIAERLQELRDRLSGLAGELQVLETAAAGAEASRAVTGVQRRTWGVAADLVGVVARLELLARDLRRSSATEEPDGGSRAVAELLLATIECVIADRLDPAIQALLAEQQPLDEGEPR